MPGIWVLLQILVFIQYCLTKQADSFKREYSVCGWFFLIWDMGVQSLFEFIEGWYNPRRRHQSLGQIAPIQFENQYAESAAKPEPELSTEAG